MIDQVLVMTSLWGEY